MKPHFIHAATGVFGLLFLSLAPVNAEDKETAKTTETAKASDKTQTTEKEKSKDGYFVKTKAYRIEGEPDIPSYVRNLSKTQFKDYRDVKWLDVGLDFRTRYEYRENDYRPTVSSPVTFRDTPDNIWLLRTRAYFGVKEILDPLRFAVEFQDSRSYNSLYEKGDNDVNEFEIIQGYAELYFKNALGEDRPLSLRAGRQHLEVLDRRLLANNQFRNTSNNFEGFRLRFGKKQNNWDLDTFAFQPIDRLKYQFDRADEDTWFYGGVLSIREWSKLVTIQPYFLGRKTNGDPNNPVVGDRKNDRDIYAPGIRLYGATGKTGLDYDADLNKQFGRFSTTRAKTTYQVPLKHDAIAYSMELGYTFDHEWKPRASAYYGYGSGDKDPNRNLSSDSNERFDSFYGFNQPWSRNDYFDWANIKTPKARIEFTPYKDVRIDTGYHAFWADSATDGWNRAGLRDLTGSSSNFLGHEFDMRLRHQLNPYVEWNLSYARFTPGNFTSSQAKPVTGPYTTEPTNYFYFEVNLNAFGDGKPK